jgi:hypothetical protein
MASTTSSGVGTKMTSGRRVGASCGAACANTVGALASETTTARASKRLVMRKFLLKRER